MFGAARRPGLVQSEGGAGREGGDDSNKDVDAVCMRACVSESECSVSVSVSVTVTVTVIVIVSGV